MFNVFVKCDIIITTEIKYLRAEDQHDVYMITKVGIAN